MLAKRRSSMGGHQKMPDKENNGNAPCQTASQRLKKEKRAALVQGETTERGPGCMCPMVCVEGTAISKNKIPDGAVKFICSNPHCTHVPYIHDTCYVNWETDLIEKYKHLWRGERHKKWSLDLIRHNLWQERGYFVIRPVTECLCAKGHIRRDQEYDYQKKVEELEKTPPEAAKTAQEPRRRSAAKEKPMLKFSGAGSVATTVRGPTMSAGKQPLVKQNNHTGPALAERFGEGSQQPHQIPGLSIPSKALQSPQSSRQRKTSTSSSNGGNVPPLPMHSGVLEDGREPGDRTEHLERNGATTEDETASEDADEEGGGWEVVGQKKAKQQHNATPFYCEYPSQVQKGALKQAQRRSRKNGSFLDSGGVRGGSHQTIKPKPLMEVDLTEWERQAKSEWNYVTPATATPATPAVEWICSEEELLREIIALVEQHGGALSVDGPVLKALGARVQLGGGDGQMATKIDLAQWASGQLRLNVLDGLISVDSDESCISDYQLYSEWQSGFAVPVPFGLAAEMQQALGFAQKDPLPTPRTEVAPSAIASKNKAGGDVMSRYEEVTTQLRQYAEYYRAQ